MSELAQVVAYVFRHQPKERLGRNEFKQFLAFRLNWFPPAQAAQLLERALASGLLVAQEDHVRPGFDVHSVELPVAFRPTARALEEPAAAPPPAAASPASDPALEERARALRDLARGLLSEEAARLLAARERGADVRGLSAKALSLMQVSAQSSG